MGPLRRSSPRHVTAALALALAVLAVTAGHVGSVSAATASGSTPGTTATSPSTSVAPPPSAPATSPSTRAPAATTPVASTLPTSSGGPGGTGVPAVPTGGPPTTPAPPGPPPPPPAPVDPRPSIEAVDTDLAQLSAIAAVPQAQSNVGIAQLRLAAASQALVGARSGQTLVDARRQAAVSSLAGAQAKMTALALAAYTGETYVPDAASPAATAASVATLGDAAGEVAGESQVLLGVVVDQTKRGFTLAKQVVKAADADSAQAAAGVAGATASLAAATRAVGTAQQVLAATTQAATVPGAAARQAIAKGPATLAPAMVPYTGSPAILSSSVLTGAELAAWYAASGRNPNITVPMAQLADDYLTAGAQTGVRADVAYAQSIIETGYFSFPAGGQLVGTDNNFAGIGACDSCSHGWLFPDAFTGVSAQMQLLEAYASRTKIATPLVGPVGVGGCCATWTSLAGTWASNPSYGVEILALYKQMLEWIIPQRLVTAGLVTPAVTLTPPSG